MTDFVEVENVNTPGRTTRVNRRKYEAMRRAVELVTPMDEPGLTASDMKEATKMFLPHELFPDGKTSGWWQKSVQLDLEAKGILVRHPTKPLTFTLKI